MLAWGGYDQIPDIQESVSIIWMLSDKEGNARESGGCWKIWWSVENGEEDEV